MGIGRGNTAKNTGDEGEEIASNHLESLGFKIASRNVSYKTGEIDIIAWKGEEIHFVEVKTRKMGSLIEPIEAVTEQKRKKIKRTAEVYLSDFKNGFDDRKLPTCCFDVLTVNMNSSPPKVDCYFEVF